MSAHPFNKYINSIPAASAVLIIVPKFPGSEIPSRINILLISFNSDFLTDKFLIDTAAAIPCGFIVSTLSLNSLSLTV